MKRIVLIAAVLAFAGGLTPANAAGRGFTADFTNCSEFAGWGPVANTPLATSLVPADFTTLLESGQATIVLIQPIWGRTVARVTRPAAV